MMRNSATAASVTRIIEPAARAVPENQISPGRLFASIFVVAGAAVISSVRVVVRIRPRSAVRRSGAETRVLLDLVDRGLRLGGELRRDRRAAGVLRGGLLTRLADG